MNMIKPYISLSRISISLSAACSAATGYFLAPHHPFPLVLLPVLAVFLLACAASALNQYQEYVQDGMMERTRNRPVPSGRISRGKALIFAVIIMAGGLVLLLISGGVTAFFLGMAALIWYNGIYTHLKRVSAFAAVPGAIVGMIPPAIGWASAGASLFDAQLAVICCIFFLWQVPHFWMLILKHGDEYKRAGFPSLTMVMPREQIARIVFAWIVAAAITTIALPLYGVVQSKAIFFALLALSAWLVWNERSLATARSLNNCPASLFRNLNIYLFLNMSILSLQHLFT